jgi:hemolysin III
MVTRERPSPAPEPAARVAWRRAAGNLRAHAGAALRPSTAPLSDHRHDGVAKPTWRGRQHTYALIAAVPATGALFAFAPARRRWPVALYGGALIATLGVSAAYHTFAASRASQEAMSRADRATIYALIAGTATPVLAYTTSARSARWILPAAWSAAAVGAGMRATGRANRTASAGYVVLGWVGAVGVRHTWAVSPTSCILLIAGGTAYTAGAVMYGTHRPTLAPATFGYHEAFHTMTVVGFATHYAAVAILAVKARRAATPGPGVTA